MADYKEADKFMQFVVICDEGHNHEHSVLLGSMMGVQVGPRDNQETKIGNILLYTVHVDVIGIGGGLLVGNNLSYVKADSLKAEIEKRIAKFQDIHRADMLGQHKEA